MNNTAEQALFFYRSAAEVSTTSRIPNSSNTSSTRFPITATTAASLNRVSACCNKVKIYMAEVRGGAANGEFFRIKILCF